MFRHFAGFEIESQNLSGEFVYRDGYAAVAQPSDMVVSYNSGTISSATILIILINGLMAGPAVSL